MLSEFGDHQEVERPREPHPHAVGGGQVVTAGEKEGVGRLEARAERPRIHRYAGVQMGVAPVHLGREVRPAWGE